MIRWLCLLVGVASVFSNAVLSDSELSDYQFRLNSSRGYITANGYYVNVLIPISELYQGKTTYFAQTSREATKLFEELISRSSGRIALQGLINDNAVDLNFNKSSLYAQVAHLSEYLLANTTDVSYAPVIVDAYEKNNNYGIWKLFPEDKVFLNLSLIID